MVTLLFPIFSHGLRDSVSLFVGPFVPWSDHPSRIFFLAFCGRFLHHRYCPAAGDWCCCVWYTPLPLPYTSLPLPNTRGHVLSQTPNTSNFLSWIITLDVFLAVIIIFLINFPYFFQPPPLRPGFRHFLSPCYPSPHVASLSTSHPNTWVHVFYIKLVQKTCSITRIWLTLRFFNWMGGMSIFAILGSFYPTLGNSWVHWALLKSF